MSVVLREAYDYSKSTAFDRLGKCKASNVPIHVA